MNHLTAHVVTDDNYNLLIKEPEIYFNVCNLYPYVHNDILDFLKILYINKNLIVINLEDIKAITQNLSVKLENEHKLVEENKYVLEKSLGHIEEFNILLSESFKMVNSRINDQNDKITLLEQKTSLLEQKIGSIISENNKKTSLLEQKISLIISENNKKTNLLEQKISSLESKLYEKNKKTSSFSEKLTLLETDIKSIKRKPLFITINQLIILFVFILNLI